MTNDDVQRDIDNEGQRAIPRTSRPGIVQPPGAAWENERVATALRTLADQVQAGDWSGVPNALAILGARMDRRRR